MVTKETGFLREDVRRRIPPLSSIHTNKTSKTDNLCRTLLFERYL